jgi:Kdo2-lipid IVA lauroyltransferase/acyltransferase
MDANTKAGLIYRLTALFTRLPWPVLRRLADGLAWLWTRLDARESRVTRRNLELVFPQIDATGRTRMHQQVMQATARQALETLYLWTHRPAANLARCLRQRHGQELYDSAHRSGRGLIVIAPHHGNWEMLNQWLASRGPVSIVYAPPESAVGDAFLQRARGGENITQIPAEGPAVRQMLKTLKAGGTVGILPDQQPKHGDGVFVPFFGIDALTMTLVNRLAARTGADLLYAWCERVGDGLQFDLHVEPAPPQLADADPVAATARLNADIEAIVRRNPTQYQWTYKRYTLRPEGSGQANPYADLRHRH